MLERAQHRLEKGPGYSLSGGRCNDLVAHAPKQPCRHVVLPAVDSGATQMTEQVYQSQGYWCLGTRFSITSIHQYTNIAGRPRPPHGRSLRSGGTVVPEPLFERKRPSSPAPPCMVQGPQRLNGGLDLLGQLRRGCPDLFDLLVEILDLGCLRCLFFWGSFSLRWNFSIFCSPPQSLFPSHVVPVLRRLGAH